VGNYTVRGAAFTADARVGLRSVTVVITGEFDIECELAAAAMVGEVLDDRPGAEQLTVDLSGCSFFSSSGLRFLTGIWARCLLEGIEVDVRSSPCVQRVLALSDADMLLQALEPFTVAA
jgi:anti-anti-sigma factor